MLILTLRQLQDKLPAWLDSRLSVALIGPPGTGKTHTSRAVAEATGRPVEVLDGGQENEWKALFPYRTPSGEIQPGKALMADGGTLVIDEFNRVPPELKSAFQLLASEKIVPWPEGGVREVDLAIVATANDADLGVEEAGRAELDRYDLIVKLAPTPEEIGAIVSRQAEIREEVAAMIYEAVAELAKKLDPKKFHQPEGIRMAISIAKLLRGGTLGPADSFRGAAERCFPLGRRGSEKSRAEFDQTVADAAGRFAAKLANVGQVAASGAASGADQASAAPAAATLQDLAAALPQMLTATVSSPALELPRPFVQLAHMVTQAFGLGVTKYFALGRRPGASMEKRGVIVHFGATGVADKIEFRGCDKHRVEKLLKLLLGL